MYINFWYPVCTASELRPGEPLPVRVLGLPLVAFRDEQGEAHVLSDTCVHRGGSLARGKVRGNCVECPYHGWRFGGDGRCEAIPSLGDQKLPARAKVDAYPVQERYGIVFAFLGDLPEGERPPLYEIPEYGTGGWRASEIVILDVACNYERSMENGLDPAHNEFVHPRQGFPPMHHETLRLVDEAWGSRFEAHFGDPQLEKTTFARERNRTGELRAGSWFHGPNVLVTSIFINAESNLIQTFFEQPIDDSHTRIYFINLRNCMLDPAMDDKVMAVNVGIAREDIGILENLRPVRAPRSTTREIMVPTDVVVVRFREWLRRWDAQGWRVNVQALKAAAGDVAFAIPCPARRTTANWVLPAVPLEAAAPVPAAEAHLVPAP